MEVKLPLTARLVFLARSVLTIAVVSSVPQTSGPTMNNEGMSATQEMPRIQRLPPRNKGQPILYYRARHLCEQVTCSHHPLSLPVLTLVRGCP